MVYRRTAAVCARQEATRVRLLAAARALVAEHGLAGTGVAAVAASAGVGVGTVYRYFPSKADLIGEVVREVCRRELEVVAEVAASEGTPTERLVAAVTVFARRARRSGRTAYAVIAEPAEPTVELLRLEIRAELAASFAAVVADGVASGEFPEQPPTVSGTALVGAVSEVLVGPTPRPHHDDPVDDLVRFALRAVTGRQEDPR